MSEIILKDIEVSYQIAKKPLFTKRGSLNYYEAIKTLSLHLKSGDRLALLGSNGSGKSTLLRVLAGILPPIKGSLEINGEVFPALSPVYGIQREATCYENIRLKGLLYNFRGKELKAYENAVAQFSELNEFLDMPVKTLSKGMQSRLQVAMLNHVKPDILLMDEWIGAADENIVRKNNGILNALVDQAEIFVLASHRKKLVKDFCTTGLVMQKGEIVFHGGIKEALEVHTSSQKNK